MQVNSKPLDSSVDDLLFIFADTNVLLAQPRMIRRFDRDIDRYYYTIEGGIDGPMLAKFFVSTTTFCKKVMHNEPALLEWMKKEGANADVYRDQRASYGTLMHISFAEFHEHGYDFRTTRERVGEYVKSLGYPHALIPGWTSDLNKAVASYAQFCLDYKVEPILIEGMLASDEMGIAGTLDLVARMETPKLGRFIGQTDFKSGSIHKSAEVQLVINKLIFEENFPHLEIDRLYSWSPKDFLKETPTYTLKDQTDTKVKPKHIDAYREIYDMWYGNELAGKQYHTFAGTLMPGQDVTNFHKLMNIGDMVLEDYNS